MLLEVFAFLVHVCAKVAGDIDLQSPSLSKSPNLKIINGHDARVGVHPFMVRVLSPTTSCGGSLISNQHILTAAHCLKGAASINAVLGAHNYSADEPSLQVQYSTNFKIHPNYIDKTSNHDIAIAKLARPVTLNEYVKVVKLPPRSAANHTEDFYANKSARVYGWGQTKTEPVIERPDVLQALKMKVLSHSDNLCYIFQIPNDVLCVTRDGTGTGSVCHGDSGGPLIYGGVQIGVVSGHKGVPCEISQVAKFVRVDWHIDWIYDTMATM